MSWAIMEGMNVVTIGIVSIAIGFICFLSAYYTFQRGKDRRVPIALGIATLVFLTIIPVFCAVFYAATSNGY